MTRVLVLSLVTLALAGAAHAGSPTFSAQVTNPWFPLAAPGSRYIYTGVGIGVLLEQTQRGGNERNELVSFSRS